MQPRRFAYPLLPIALMIASSLPLRVHGIGDAPQSPPTFVDPESYAVYVAAIAASQHPQKLVQAETVSNSSCFPSDFPPGADWQSVAEDYRQNNTRLQTLLPQFLDGAPFRAVPRVDAVRDGHYMEVSAVGFNRDRTRALVRIA